MLSKLSQMRPRSGLVWIVALTCTTFLHGAAINGHPAPSPGTKVTTESGAKAVGFFEEATIGVNVEERAASLVLHPHSGCSEKLAAENCRSHTFSDANFTDPLEPHPDIDDEDYQKLVSKGHKLHELMKATIQEADQIMHDHSQSQFTKYHDLHRYGWLNHKSDTGKAFYRRYGFYLNAAVDEHSNHDRKIEHSLSWRNPSTGHMMTPTYGFFQNVYNIRARVIYIIHRESPSSMVKRRPNLTVPPLKFWSDVTFLEWASEHDDMANVHAPKYILISNAVNVQSQEVFEYIKKKRDIKEWGDLPGGVEFGHNDTPYFALLATPNVYGSAYFLIQHKAQMKIHIIESIKLFGTGITTNILIKIVEHQNDNSIRALISSAPTNKIHYNSSSSYSKL